MRIVKVQVRSWLIEMQLLGLRQRVAIWLLEAALWVCRRVAGQWRESQTKTVEDQRCDS